MNSLTIYCIIGVVAMTIIYYIYRKIKKKNMVNKDYNRKINDYDLKVRNDLSVLRKELMKTDSPEIRNQILNKIDLIIKNREKEGNEK